MPESSIHIDLVLLMEAYAKHELGINDGFILLDTPGHLIGNKPPLVNDRRPDMYIRTSEMLIIGEAKTTSDWNTKHSISQYKSYFQECIDFCGNALLLIAVPWHIERGVRNYLRHLFRDARNELVLLTVISDMWRGQCAKD